MSKSPVSELTVETLVKGGDGLARVDGEVWFIPGTVPGDRILCRPLESTGRYTRARLEKILEASSQRVEPPCPLASRCGGCPWQHIHLAQQRRAKIQIVRDLFTRSLPPASASLKALEAIDYISMDGDGLSWRNRFQFHRSDNSDLSVSPVGLMDMGGQRVVPLSDCPIAEPGIQRALKEKSLKAPLSQNRFTVYARDDLFLCEGQKEEGLVRILDRELRLSAALFFQSNALMLERLLQSILSILPGVDRDRPALDLYAGVGTFSVFLKDHFPSLILMEKERRSLALARENLKGAAASFHALSDDEWVRLQDRDRAKHKAPSQAGLAIVDPPRAGLSERMRNYLASSGIPTIVSVSCDPASHARDVSALEKAGYGLSSLTLFEFYPHSPHIESLALLERRV